MTNDISDHSNSAAEKDGMLRQKQDAESRTEAAALSIDFDTDAEHEPVMHSIRGGGRRTTAQHRYSLILHRTLIFTAIFEGITCFMRFGLGLQSTRDTGSLAKFTGGLRIHHGYLGILLAAVSYLRCRDRSSVHLWMLPVGLALILSDLIHHFIVLYATTGDPQFDLVYPN